MTEGGDGTTDSLSGAPVDFDRLEAIRERFAADDRFVRIGSQPEFAPDRLVCLYDTRFYPGSVQTAQLEIVWFENGDFSLHTTKYTTEVRSTIDGIDIHLATMPEITSTRNRTHRYLARTRHTRQTGETSSRWS